MKSFTDSQDRQWDMQITIGSIKKVKSRCDIDLLNFGEKGFLKPLIEDPYTLAEMFWALLETQAKEKGVDEQSFAEGLAGETIVVATRVFLEDLLDFFPGSKKEAAKTVLAKTKDLVETAYKDVAKKAEGLNVQELYEDAKEKLSLESK